MNIPLSPLLLFLNTIVCFACGGKLYGVYRRDQSNKVVDHFVKAYIFFAVAYLFFSLPWLLIPQERFYLGVMMILGSLFLFIAYGYLTMTTTFFLDPLRYRVSFFLFLLLASVVLLVDIAFFSFPLFDNASGLLDWNLDTVPRIASAVLLLSVVVPSALYFLLQSFSSPNPIVRTRSLLLLFGFLLLSAAAVLVYSVKPLPLLILATSLSTLAFLVLFLGVYYKRQ